jgi:hypothetical protein
MLKNLDNWILSYITQRISTIRKKKVSMPAKVVFCFVDHFEPFWGKVDRSTALQRVKSWVTQYPKIAQAHMDSMGNHPRYTFFYPEEEYDSELLDMLADLCARGYGEVEVHLHHDNDNSENLKQKLLAFKDLLAKKHGLLSTNRATGEINYGFIHGNWALDNSRKDGRWCGVNNELTVLQETGCYADFTLPSAPSDTQTRKINSIYYAIDNPDEPKSHDSGTDVKVNTIDPNGLLIIQGPLCLNWHNKKFGILPRIENSSLTYDNPITTERLKLWAKHGPRIQGQCVWVLIKIHTHGCQEKNIEYLLSGGLDKVYSMLESSFNDEIDCSLHYSSAREMFNLIKALEANKTDCATDWRDYRLRKNFAGVGPKAD